MCNYFAKMVSSYDWLNSQKTSFRHRLIVIDLDLSRYLLRGREHDQSIYVRDLSYQVLGGDITPSNNGRTRLTQKINKK